MKKLYILIYLSLFSCNIYSLFYQNPFWKNESDYSKILNISNLFFSKPQFIINLNFSYEYIDFIRNGLCYDIEQEIRFGKLLNFNYTFKHTRNDFFPDNISFYWNLYPHKFFNFSFGYYNRNFLDYNINEHNLIIDNKININLLKWFQFYHIIGVNFRFIDLNINNNKKIYKKDWLFETIIYFQIKFLFNPLFFYSIGLTIGNYDRYEIFSANYWQIELLNYFHLYYNISIIFNTGYGYSGAIPFAGYINRFWIKFGIRYEIKTYK